MINRKGVPIYMRSASSNEMWPALLEKAYAKAKGSYELLNHWLPVDGCIELTGNKGNYYKALRKRPDRFQFQVEYLRGSRIFLPF
jgi:hypothetical protein